MNNRIDLTKWICTSSPFKQALLTAGLALAWVVLCCGLLALLQLAVYGRVLWR